MSFVAKHFHPGEGSHIPVLIKMLNKTTGPVLELGTGFNSTPVLHWLCKIQKRKLVSYESVPVFWDVAKNYIDEFHEVNFIHNWDDLDVSKHWGIIFIDHAPGKRRVEELKRLANSADYVILHDAEDRSDWHYKFSEGFPKYKYKYDYPHAYPQTSVLSNFKNDMKEICE